MKKNTPLLLGLLFTGTTLACTVLQGPQFSATVVATSLTEVGQRLQEQLGSQFGPDVDVEGYVLVRPSARLPGGAPIPFHKPCGQTFEERGAELDPSNQNNNTGTGSGGGGYSPSPRPWFPPSGCIGNCGGTVTVGDITSTG